MLRASAQKAGTPVDVRGVVDVSTSVGVAHGEVLIGFSDALVSGNRLGEARDALMASLGPVATARAAGVVATFEMMNRILDAGVVQVKARTRERLVEVGLPVDW